MAPDGLEDIQEDALVDEQYLKEELFEDEAEEEE